MAAEVGEGTKRTAWAIRGLGLIMLAAGALAALVGPIEVHTFYAFAEGGRFHYEGFGFGSFMFANIAAQTAGYYVIALILIPLGYGHMALRRWAKALSETLLCLWLVVGLPLALVGLVLLADSKALPPQAVYLLLPVLAVAYPIAPILLLRFYGSAGARVALEPEASHPGWLEGIPMAVRVLAGLLLLALIPLHGLLLFSAPFPLFGPLLMGTKGALAIGVAALLLVVLIWGLLRLSRWAWVATLALLLATTGSAWMTFAGRTLADLLHAVKLPDAELAWFQGVPFLDASMAIPISLPLLVAIGLTVAAGPSMFRAGRSLH